MSSSQQASKNLVDLSFQRLQKFASSQLHELELNQPFTITVLAHSPQFMLRYIVEVWKLQKYIQKHQKILQIDAKMLKELFVVYRKKLMTMSISHFENEEQAQLMAKHVSYFVWVMALYNIPDPALSQEYIRLLIAANSLGFNLYSDFPKYLLSLKDLSFSVFCICITQFCRRPYNYKFNEITKPLTNLIFNSLSQFLKTSPKLRSHDNEIKQFNRLVTAILSLYNSPIPNQISTPFKSQIMDQLLLNEEFNQIIFTLMRKIDGMSFFKNWVECIIKLGAHKKAMRAVQYAMICFSGLTDKMGILQLIQANDEWAYQWAQSIIGRKIEFSSSLFLRGQPFYLIFFNKMMTFVPFENPEVFLGTLRSIGYEGIVRSMKHTQSSKQSMLNLFSLFFDDYEELVNELLKESDRCII